MSKFINRMLPGVALVATLALGGCHKTNDQNQPDSSDPASANLATDSNAVIDNSAQQPAQQPYPQQQATTTTRARSYAGSSSAMAPAPPADTTAYNNSSSNNGSYPQQSEQSGYGQGNYNQNTSAQYADEYAGQDSAYSDYAQPVYAEQPPPPLPEYQQPECPGNNYMWTPGYWNYAPAGYYWVPGIWVIAPFLHALWTPGYWGYDSNRYAFHHGYWGDHIGFYGGVPYGNGYTGRGYEGGYWNNNNFYYNRSVNRINDQHVTNIYEHNVTIINNDNRVSYNGGRGGIDARPTQNEVLAQREQHIAPLPAQLQHARQASQNRAQFASVNNGRPQMLTAARPIEGRTAPTVAGLRTVQGRPAVPIAPRGNTAPVNVQNRNEPNRVQQNGPEQNRAEQNRPGQPQNTENHGQAAVQNHPQTNPQNNAQHAVQNQQHPVQNQQHPVQNQQHPAQNEQHPAAQQANHPQQPNRPETNQQRPGVTPQPNHTAQTNTARPEIQNHTNQPAAQQHPVQQSHPAPQQERPQQHNQPAHNAEPARPQPAEQRPQPQRPAETARPQQPRPQEQSHPQPQEHPEQGQHPQPQQEHQQQHEEHPAPHNDEHPR